jgi:PRTRC genetic system protein A
MSAVPIRMLTEDSDDSQYVQAGPIEYVVASNGAFLSIKNDFVDAIVPSKELAGLREQKNYCKWKLPPIPAALMYQVVKFFKEVADKHDTEVAVLLHFGEGEWGVSVPKQQVSAGHVDYKVGVADRMPGKRMIGTMHSHVDMSAWHSSTDDDDEAQFDGLHVTLGKMDRVPQFVDVDATVVVRGAKFTIAHNRFTEGLAKSPEGGSERKSKWGFTTYSVNPTHSLVDRAAFNRVKVPHGWHSQVTKKKWTYGNFSGTDYGYGYNEFSGDVEEDKESGGKGKGIVRNVTRCRDEDFH